MSDWPKLSSATPSGIPVSLRFAGRQDEREHVQQHAALLDEQDALDRDCRVRVNHERRAFKKWDEERQNSEELIFRELRKETLHQ